mgnify:FL=1
MNLITNTISAVYNLLWGDLFAVPLPGGGSIPLTVDVATLVGALGGGS